MSAATAAPAGVTADAAPVANAFAVEEVPVALLVPVDEAAEVGEAVVAVFATLATEAMEDEAAALRLHKSAYSPVIQVGEVLGVRVAKDDETG